MLGTEQSRRVPSAEDADRAVTTSATWVELRRGSTVVLVPFTAWYDVLLGPKLPDQPERDEPSGMVRVSANSALVLAARVSALGADEFERTFGSKDLGPGVMGTVMVGALEPAAAAETKAELLRLLRSGAFEWRLVSL